MQISIIPLLVPVPGRNTEVPITDILDLDSDGQSFGQHLPLGSSDVIIEYKVTWLSYLLRKFCETRTLWKGGKVSK